MRYLRTGLNVLPVLALGGTLLLPACGGGENTGTETTSVAPGRVEAASASAAPAGQSPATDGPYAFDAPTASVPLAAELKEISGLALLADGRVGAVQDETGVLYVLDAKTGAIQQKVPFQEAGDYEGIELAGDRLFVLRSNGTLEELTGWQSGSPQVRTFDTHLKGKNDTEGLAYDAANNRLLISTKEDGGEGLGKDIKGIYAFDLASGTMAGQPVFTIDTDAISDRITEKGKFKPSALAVHPSTGETYVLSSVAKAVAVLDRAGSVQAVWNLPASVYEQPEGIVFLPGGDLLISSEGVDRPAMLHRIASRQTP